MQASGIIARRAPADRHPALPRSPPHGRTQTFWALQWQDAEAHQLARFSGPARDDSEPIQVDVSLVFILKTKAMNGEPKSIAAMIGEMVRDVAVLIVVFVPLEVLLAYHFTLGWIATIVVVESTLISCLVLAAVGIWIERRR